MQQRNNTNAVGFLQRNREGESFYRSIKRVHVCKISKCILQGWGEGGRSPK